MMRSHARAPPEMISRQRGSPWSRRRESTTCSPNSSGRFAAVSKKGREPTFALQKWAASRTRPRTRPGASMAIQAATTAPSLCPQRAACSMESASITPRHSSANIRWYPSGREDSRGEPP